MWERGRWIKENCKAGIEWDKKFVGRNKSIEFMSLNETVGFLDRILQEQPDNLEHTNKVKNLPWGSFLEDYSHHLQKDSCQNEINEEYRKS